MEKVKTLEAGQTYIVSHEGNNGEPIFNDDENRRYFASLVEKHILPVARVLNCEMQIKRLELKVSIRHETEIPEKYRDKLYQPFSNLFNSYTKAFNKRYKRSGSLFRVRFRRELLKRLNPDVWIRLNI